MDASISLQSLCHQTLQHIIRTTDGGACLVLKTFQSDLGSYHTCEPGCFHYLAKVTSRLGQVSPHMQCQNFPLRERS
ncbi:unnamed protein product [Ixodes persulcatus]